MLTFRGKLKSTLHSTPGSCLPTSRNFQSDQQCRSWKIISS